MEQPDVSIVVVSWNTRDLTLGCLRSIAAEAARTALATEVFLVDNASSDGTADAVRQEFPGVGLIACERNLGFAAGCNRAIPKTAGRYVLLLNPDAELARGALDRVAGFLDTHPRAGAAGARLVSPDGQPQFSCGRFLTPLNQFAETIGIGNRTPIAALRRSYSPAELARPEVEVDWAVGACLALRREALDETGLLDERFFMYSEDEDLCLRLRKAGWSVWMLADVEIRHAGGSSAAQALDRMRAQARASQSAFLQKHRGRMAAMLFRTLMRVAALKPSRSRERVGWGR